LKEYPHEDLLLRNIKGEKWKDIPGLEGYFLISNFGRIKRLEYETQYRNGASYVKPEKIIKPSLVKQFNRYKKDYTFFLTDRVTLEGIRHTFMLLRLVYCCFVRRFDLADHTTVIQFKDGNNFNIRPSNLKKAMLSEKQQNIFIRERAISPLTQLSTAKRQEIRRKIIKTKSKRITQYTLDEPKQSLISPHDSSIGSKIRLTVWKKNLPCRQENTFSGYNAVNSGYIANCTRSTLLAPKLCLPTWPKANQRHRLLQPSFDRRIPGLHRLAFLCDILIRMGWKQMHMARILIRKLGRVGL